jgi:hypothetical protein
MNNTEYRASESPPALDRRALLEEVRVRLFAITDSLSNFEMDAGQLRTTTRELGVVVHRIEWLADLSTSPSADARSK